MQGLESLNSFSKINYFRQTNRNKTQFTSMLLEKMNKMNYQVNEDSHYVLKKKNGII